MVMNLPSEILRIIYEFDSTFKIDVYKKVIEELKLHIILRFKAELNYRKYWGLRIRQDDLWFRDKALELNKDIVMSIKNITNKSIKSFIRGLLNKKKGLTYYCLVAILPNDMGWSSSRFVLR
jgi:hypothetical protein